jgi:hypothetical protein
VSAFHFSDGQSTVEGDFSQLEAIIAGLKEKHYVDIGVFGTAVTGKGKPIAEYGAYNEFGSMTRPDHPPKRSFIRMPLQSKQDKISRYVQGRAMGHIEKANIKAIFVDIGIAGESVIQEAFDTQGFGTWKPNAESTIARKGSDTPLIDDGTLRKAIASGPDAGKRIHHEGLE